MRELGGAGEPGRVDSEFRGMLLRVLDGRGSFATVEGERWWMSEVEFGMTKKGLVTKSHGNSGPSRENGGRSRQQDREEGVWESAGKEKKRWVGVLNSASWAIAGSGRGGSGCAVVTGSENRGRRRRGVSAVGTASKTGRGRRKGEKGGGVFSGEGERTTETVSHTVPNMASADQFPPSIDWPEHSTTQTKIHFSFLFGGDVTRKTTTDWNLHGLLYSRS